MRRCSPRLWLLVAGIAFGACRTGRTSAPTRVASGAPTRKGVTHVVQRGQTLYRISKTYGVSVEQLTKSNRLDGSGELSAGMKLWIPGASRVLEVPITGLSESTPAKPTPEPTKPPAKVVEKSKPAEPKRVELEKPKAEAEPTKTTVKEKSAPAEKAKAEAEPTKTVVKEKPAPAEKPAPVEKPTPKKTPPPEKVAEKDPPEGNNSGGEDGEETGDEPTEHPAKPTKEKPSGAVVKTNFIWPVKGFVQSPFGQRGSRPHDGIDIKADKGSTIVAVDAGEVIYSGVQRGYGNIVLVKHSNDLITIYAHNETNDVKQGERVTRGQAIATVGHTGRATNDHLHFEVRDNRVPKNPILYLPEH